MNRDTIAVRSLTIDRHENLSPQRWLEDYVNRGRPVVVTKGCAHWAAMHKWSPAYLREQYGSTTVRYNGGSTSLAAVLDAVSPTHPSTPPAYLIECYLFERLPGLLPDVQHIPLNSHNRVNCKLAPGYNRGRSGNPDLLIGGVGSRFPVLHYDFHQMHSFVTQIRGSKRFWLYPPTETPYLYARTDSPNRSLIDRFDAEGLQQWPLHAKAAFTVVDVLEGETIFIPSGWWHRTEILSPSIALNWNGVSKANWNAYIEDRFVSWTRHSLFKTVAKRSYYRVLGLLLDVIEVLRPIK